jgi:Ca-activated chloride channel homolog
VIEFINPYGWILGALVLPVWTLSFFGALGQGGGVYIPKQIKLQKNFFLSVGIWLLGLIGIVSLVYSFMGPRRVSGYESSRVEVSDIVLVFDVSRSMLAEDFLPNRLEAAKSIMIDYINLKPLARLSVVMFSEKVFTLVPLTTDLDVVKQAISEIDIGFLGSGTNIGDGLALAVGRLAQADAKSRVIILLTDGVNNVGSMTPTQAAEIARDRGVKIYAIGMGGDEDARIPLPGNFMGRKRYQTIPGGSIDEGSLKEISELTGGRHWMAQQAESLRQVFYEIDRLERSEVDSNSRAVYEELYYKPLLAGFILLLLTFFMRIFFLRDSL